MQLDLVLRGGRVIDPSQGVELGDGCRLPKWPGRRDRRGTFRRRGQGRQRLDRHAWPHRPPYPCLLGRHVAWGRPSPSRSRRMHDVGRRGQRRAGQLPRVSGACHPPVRSRTSPCLPQRVVRRDFWVRPSRYGRRKRRPAVDGAGRSGGGRKRQSRHRSSGSRFALACTLPNIPALSRSTSRGRRRKSLVCR